MHGRDVKTERNEVRTRFARSSSQGFFCFPTQKIYNLNDEVEETVNQYFYGFHKDFKVCEKRWIEFLECVEK